MVYQTNFKIKNIDQKATQSELLAFVRDRVLGAPPDSWCNSCRDFARAKGIEVKFTIEQVFPFVGGQLTSDNAIVTTFTARKQN